jgi:hypothetical protein
MPNWSTRDRDVSAVKVRAVFTVTTPSVTVTLSGNRMGEVPFTVTNVGNRKLRARAKVSPAPGAPSDWFSVAGDSERDFEIGAARQFVVRVDPPLGAPAGTYAFRLDAVGVENPNDDYSEGPSLPGHHSAVLRAAAEADDAARLPDDTRGRTHRRDRSRPRRRRPGPDPRNRHDCHDLGFWACLFRVFFRELAFWVGLVFLGFVLMLVGASVGSAIALRIRRFRGHRLTGTFLAAISPVVLLAVPAVLARGSVLLIRPHDI